MSSRRPPFREAGEPSHVVGGEPGPPVDRPSHAPGGSAGPSVGAARQGLLRAARLLIGLLLLVLLAGLVAWLLEPGGATGG